MKTEELELVFESLDAARADGPVAVTERCRVEGLRLLAPLSIFEREGKGVVIASVARPVLVTESAPIEAPVAATDTTDTRDESAPDGSTPEAATASPAGRAARPRRSTQVTRTER